MSDPRDVRRSSERGSVMVVAALAMVALVLFAALAIDVGFIWSSRTQSQNVSDSAALAAAQTMIKRDSPTSATYHFDQAAAETAGASYASQNATVANPSAVVRPSDFTFGTWNLTTRKLEPGDPSKPDTMTGVRADVLMDGTVNQRSPGILSRILTKSDGTHPYLQGFDVKNTAVAYLGFQGHFDPKFFELPVALDSCQLSSGGCGTDFCYKADQAASCTLERSQSHTNGLLCGEFSNTPDQNMCWVNFSDSNKAINGPDLQDIVDAGYDHVVDAGKDKSYVDNGDKTSTVDYIRDAFYGCGKKGLAARGEDHYGSGFIDSWVVKLPVVECQDATHCAGGSPQTIVGGVCFEIREVIAPAPGKACSQAPTTGTSRWIKGRPLCPNSSDPEAVALYDKYCKPKDNQSVDPGGCGFGLRANRVVLVE